MTEKEFIEIFENDGDTDWEGDNAYQGLQILAKYTDNLILGASYEEIYGPHIETLLEANITKEDLEALRKLNWGIDEYQTGLLCYV